MVTGVCVHVVIVVHPSLNRCAEGIIGGYAQVAMGEYNQLIFGVGAHGVIGEYTQG